MEPMTCSNCGAPINLKLGKCEYCGTIYHIGWSQDRLKQLEIEQINYYNNQIANLQTQIAQAEFSQRNAYLQTCIINSLPQGSYPYKGVVNSCKNMK